MAQNYVGSNNINLLTPSGQFGTRRLGGKDAASARYIFTKLEPITRTIFHPDDDDLLTYLEDDGSSIEPEFYIPVIPMVLVNGAEGIGTGWSSSVLNYSPRDVIANIRRKIQGEDLEPMTPHYTGFVGTITPEGKGKFINAGKIERVDDTTLLITELPIKKWTQNYKEFLEAMLVGDAKKPAEIKDLKENHTETTVSFTVTAEAASIDSWEKDKKGLEGKFKLSGSLSTTNMTLFDDEARIVKYDQPEEILEAFYVIRLDYYEKRKASLVKKLEFEKMTLSNKARFVEEVCSGDLVVSNRKRKDILEDLQSRGYDLIGKDAKKADKQKDDDEDEEESSGAEDEPSTAELAKGYEYLLGMAIWSLTYEKAALLREQLEQKSLDLETLLATAPSTIWLNDLDALESALDERDAAMDKAEAAEVRAQKKNRKHQANKATKKKAVAKKKIKKKDEWDSEDEDESENEMDIDSEEEVVPAKKAPVAKKPVEKAAAKKAPALKAKAATAATKSQVAKRPPTPPQDDSDDELGPGLAERLQSKMHVSPPPKKKAPSKRDSNSSEESKKRPSPRSSDLTDSEDDFMADDAKPLPPKVKRGAAPAAGKKKAAATEKDEFLFDSDEESTSKPKQKKPAAKKKPAARAKKSTIDDGSDSDSDGFVGDSDSDDEVAVAAASSRAPRRAAARAKPVIYDVNSSDEESDASL